MKTVLHWLRKSLVLAGAGVCSLVAIAEPASSKQSMQPQPASRIALDAYGFTPFADTLAHSEISLLTVNFVGSSHLLFTFATRQLIARDPDQQEDDHDRILHAVLLDLKTGKAVAQHDWRVHDRGRYLWALADGRFLLRIRNSLYAVTPLTAAPGQELVPRMILPANGKVLHTVDVSADGYLFALQKEAALPVGEDPDLTRNHSIDFRMYEVAGGAFAETGHATLSHIVGAPFNRFGFLSAVQDNTQEWGFDMHGFHGATAQLAGIQSTCSPSASFISRAEFLVSACRGGEARSMMGVLNIHGKVLWIGPGPSPAWPSYDSAPSAERFVVRNTLSAQEAFGAENHITDSKGQMFTVYRTLTGESLFQVVTHPSFRVSQNFAISADGLHLVVLQDDTLEVYTLPPLTAKDKEAGAHAGESEPDEAK